MKPQLKEVIIYIVITILIIGNIYQVTVTKKLKTKLNSEVSSLEGDLSSLEDRSIMLNPIWKKQLLELMMSRVR
jgi:hypothetical protein